MVTQRSKLVPQYVQATETDPVRQKISAFESRVKVRFATLFVAVVVVVVVVAAAVVVVVVVVRAPRSL
jgi:hypothetical protein